MASSGKNTLRRSDVDELCSKSSVGHHADDVSFFFAFAKQALELDDRH